MDNLSFIWDIFRWTLLFVALLTPLLLAVSSTFRYYAKMTTFHFLILLVTSILTIICLPWPGDVTNWRLCKWLMLNFCSIFGIKWELRGEEKLKQMKEPCILIGNHQSSLDLIGMMEMWPDRCIPMVKQELKYAGSVGLSGMLMGTVFIDRFSKDKAIEACNESLEYIRKRNAKLWVFPEGTRCREATMLPFKRGAFHLAIQGQLPIIPVVFSNYSFFYSKHERKFRNDGFVIIEVLDPIPTKGLSIDDVADLAERARATMMKEYERINLEAAQKYESDNLLAK